MNAPIRTGQKFVMRAPCTQCTCQEGEIRPRGQQDCVFCIGCGRFQYNAPRVEIGQRKRTVTTVHNGIKPKQRARILERAHYRCEVCHNQAPLHVGHILSVKEGLELGIGLTEFQLNSDENLFACCEECNLGQSKLPVPLWLAASLVMARAKHSEGSK